MHLGGFKFKEAVAWLGGNISRDAAINQYQAEARKQAERILDTTPAPKLHVPEPVVGKLDRVRNYLTVKRGIPEAIVDNAIDKGRLWADKYANAVFSLRDLEGKQIGAELRGTSDKPFHGVRGEKGLFFTGTSKPKTAVFVESAIDAMSYQAIHPNTLVIGTAGSGRDMMTVLRERSMKKASNSSPVSTLISRAMLKARPSQQPFKALWSVNCQPQAKTGTMN